MKNSYQTTGKILQRIAFLVSLWMLFSFGIVAYSQSDMPNIYYYSREDQGFFIQRADGGERQLLAPYTVEETYDGQVGIWGAGWSPSGNWFNWISRPAGGEPSYASTANFLRYPDQTAQTISTEIERGGIKSTEWSPTADLLLIISYDVMDVLMPVIALYDPANEEYLWRYTSPQIPLYPQQIEWSPNGQFITVSLINTILLLPIETGAEIVTLQAQLPTPSRCSSYALPYWLSDGRFVFTRSIDELVITDVQSEEQNSIMLPFGEIEHIDWSPDEQYALIYTKSEEGSRFQLYLLTLAGRSISLISDDVRITSNCTTSQWSYDGQHAAFMMGDGRLTLFSIRGEVADISPDNDGEMRLGSRLEWAMGNRLLFSWYSNPAYQFELYQYDVDDGELENLSTTLFSDPSQVYYFSVQDNRLFLNGFLVNLETREVTELVPTGDLVIDVGRTDAVRWHPSGQWLFLLSGSNSLYWVKLASTTGSVTPEIALCPLDSQACYGWMP